MDLSSSILIVDDDPVSRTVIAGVLKLEGYHVAEADSGETALEYTKEFVPDLILMDVSMPGMNGFETVKTIKKSTAFVDVPIIFMTSLEDHASRVIGFDSGGVDYLIKPAYREELVARIRVHLRLRQSYQALIKEHFNQLDSLREAQKLLLPNPDKLPGANFAATYIPLSHAGGDFFDVFQSGEDSFDYVVADVSGHNLGASLPTSAIKALLRQNAHMAYTPEESLKLLNTHLSSVFAESQYATIAYLRVNRRTRKASWANAGHVPALRIGIGGDLCEQVDFPSSPIGCFDYFEPGLTEFSLKDGERLVLLTDGIVEQLKGSRVTRTTGYQALIEARLKFRDSPLKTFTDEIVKELHPNPSTYTDDLLLFAIEPI